MEEEFDAPSQTGNVPKWMVTFADLSTLLLCFFVLLLSFSEMDVAKFKQLAGSMREAFGVQADIKAKHIPKGTSIIAQEFSPGKPQPTVLNQVRQFTIDSNRNTLDFVDPDKVVEVEKVEQLKEYQKYVEEAEEDAQRARELLAREIEQGMIDVRTIGARTIIHIREKGSFALGSAEVEETFLPVLAKIHGLLSQTEGVIRVAGHTDNLPIATLRFRSNWELSSARAVTVLHALLDLECLDPERLVVAGYADTRPVASNDDHRGRAKNRRVDISIVRGDDYTEPEYLDALMRAEPL
ncbi:MAG: MotB family protein [Pseudomonadales bacterium]